MLRIFSQFWQFYRQKSDIEASQPISGTPRRYQIPIFEISGSYESVFLSLASITLKPLEKIYH